MKIFVSYSRRDSGDFANQIHRHLSVFKYDIFTDVNGIRGGDVWSKTIEENISNCDIFVVILTHGALKSPHVEREVLQAQKEKKTIIPCFHTSITTRYIDKWELNKFQGVEFDEKYELARDLYVMIDPIDNPSEGRNGTKTYGDLSRRSAQWYLDKGKEWESIDENENALKQYQNAIKEEPENFLVRCELSFFLERIGTINEALEAIEQAIDLKPTNAEVWYHKARILEKLGKYEEAIVALTKDLKLDSKDIKSWTSKSKLLEKVGRYEEALEAIDKIINIDSTNIDAFEQKGKIFEKLKRYKEAISCFDKVLSIDKNNEEAIKNKESSEENLKKQKYSDLISKIESLFYKQKDYSTVIDLCDKAIDIDKENYIAYLYKGKSLQQLSKYKDAIACYDKVLSIDKNNEEAIKNKEIVLEYLKKQKYTTVSDELLICYQSGNNDHKVITLSDEAIKLYPQHYEPYLYKGNILAKLKKFEDVVECYYKAMLLNLEDSVLWIQNDNMIYENLKQYKKSLNKNNNNLNYILDQVRKKTLLLSLEAHSDQVASVAISPDNTKIVSPIGKKINIWDIVTGKLLNTLEGHSGKISSIAISPDNTKIVSGSSDKTINLWDISTGKLLNTLEGHFGKVTSVVISPDNKKIVSPNGKKIYILDINTGKLLKTLDGHSGKVTSVVISPDNKKIVSPYDNKIDIWDIATGKLLNTVDDGYFEYLGSVGSVAISPDNKKIVSPNGKKIYILDINTGKLLKTLDGHSGKVTSVVISPDNKKIVSGSLSGALDKTIKTIRVWDIATGELLKEMSHTVDEEYFTDFEAVGSFAYTEEVAMIGSVGGTVVGMVAISPDNTKIVSPIGKKINIWDIVTGKLLNTLEGHSGKISSIAISPDNTKIVSGSLFDKTIKVWLLIT